MTDSQTKIQAECRRVEAILLDKNKQYGNSALEPMRIFSRANPEEQLLVRIDDKLSRLVNRTDPEDVILDLIGYLILLRVARSTKKETAIPFDVAMLAEGP